jgi:hypothetical protein
MTEQNIRIEEVSVSGDSLLRELKEIIHEGNIRRITIKNVDGISLIEIPLTLGLVGAVLLPVWAAIGAIAALAVRYTIVIEKVVEPADESHAEPAAETEAE